jgi:hypothetical protein
MITYKWSILEIFGSDQSVEKVRFLITAQDDQNTVETEGEHTFLERSIELPFAEIKEQNLINSLIKDTTKDEVNLIKLNLEKQLEALKTSKKIGFPWESDTFTIG